MPRKQGDAGTHAALEVRGAGRWARAGRACAQGAPAGATARLLLAARLATGSLPATPPPAPTQVVPLSSRDCLLPGRYPRFTMAAQAAASVRVAWQGLRQLLPETYVDTTGWAFPYPLARLAGARVAAYVHYPTISTDMLQRWGARPGWGMGPGRAGAGGQRLERARLAHPATPPARLRSLAACRAPPLPLVAQPRPPQCPAAWRAGCGSATLCTTTLTTWPPPPPSRSSSWHTTTASPWCTARWAPVRRWGTACPHGTMPSRAGWHAPLACCCRANKHACKCAQAAWLHMRHAGWLRAGEAAPGRAPAAGGHGEQQLDATAHRRAVVAVAQAPARLPALRHLRAAGKHPAAGAPPSPAGEPCSGPAGPPSGAPAL